MLDYAKMIPPEVVEAAARELAPRAKWGKSNPTAAQKLHMHIARQSARAAIAAAMAAWTGVAPYGYYTANGPRDALILPLPQEPGDE